MGWWSYLIASPVGRFLALGSALVMVLVSAYVKIRSDAVAGATAESTQDSLKRTQDAIAAGDSVDVSPERLLEDDGNRRD
jgi:hypothetical protein